MQLLATPAPEDLLRILVEPAKRSGYDFDDRELPSRMVQAVADQPGALAHVCEILAGEHINIDYAYCSSGGRNGRVIGIFKVTNADKAARVLGGGTNSASRRLERRPLRDQRSYTAPKGNAAKR